MSQTKQDMYVHGIRFRWDVDAEEYTADVSPADINEVYEDGYDQGQAEAFADQGY